jgi:hypothetical protein
MIHHIIISERHAVLENVRKDTAFPLHNQFQDTGLRKWICFKPIEEPSRDIWELTVQLSS